MQRKQIALVVIQVALGGLIGSSCDREPQHELLSILPEPNSSGMANTLVSVNMSDGDQTAIGSTGGTPEQLWLTADPTSGDLFGVNILSSPGVVMRIDSATGEVIDTLESEESTRAIAFAPDGQLYGTVHGRTLVTINTSSGLMGLIGVVDTESTIMGMTFSADGTLYAVLKNDEPFEQFIVTINPGTAEILSSTKTGAACIGDIAWAPDGWIYSTNFTWQLFRSHPESGDQEGVGTGDLGTLQGLAIVLD